MTVGKLDVNDNPLTMAAPEALKLPSGPNQFQLHNAGALANIDVPGDVTLKADGDSDPKADGDPDPKADGGDDIDQQLAYAGDYHAYYDAIPASGGMTPAHDGKLSVDELPAEIEADAHALISFYSDYSDYADHPDLPMLDHLSFEGHAVDGDFGLTQNDLEYFVEEGIITFTEIDSPDAGGPNIAMSIDLDAIPQDRLEQAFTWEAVMIKGSSFDAIIDGREPLEYGEFSRLTFTDMAKDIFSFDESDDHAMGLVSEIFDEVKAIRKEEAKGLDDPSDVIISGSYTAEEVVMAMTRRDIMPSDFNPELVDKEDFQDMVGSIE